MGPGDAPRLGGGSKPVRGTGSGGAVLQRPGRRGRWAAAGMCGVLSGSQPSPPRPVPASTLYTEQAGTATVASLDVTSHQ